LEETSATPTPTPTTTTAAATTKQYCDLNAVATQPDGAADAVADGVADDVADAVACCGGDETLSRDLQKAQQHAARAAAVEANQAAGLSYAAMLNTNPDPDANSP